VEIKNTQSRSSFVEKKKYRHGREAEKAGGGCGRQTVICGDRSPPSHLKRNAGGGGGHGIE